MSRLARVTQAEERLDQPQSDVRLLEQSLRHVAQVNRWLGGDRSVLRVLRQSDPRQPLALLDIGTGSAALPRRIVHWARRSQRAITVRATDVHPQTLALARQACRDYPEIIVENANALQLPYQSGTFTHALLTLTLHHFNDAEQLIVLRELVRVSRQAAVVSELERGWPNYLGSRLLAATWWRRNPITRHDGPLSVLRAFTPAELAAVAHRAGLQTTVQRGFFYRLLLVIPAQ